MRSILMGGRHKRQLLPLGVRLLALLAQWVPQLPWLPSLRLPHVWQVMPVGGRWQARRKLLEMESETL